MLMAKDRLSIGPGATFQAAREVPLAKYEKVVGRVWFVFVLDNLGQSFLFGPLFPPQSTALGKPTL